MNEDKTILMATNKKIIDEFLKQYIKDIEVYDEDHDMSFFEIINEIHGFTNIDEYEILKLTMLWLMEKGEDIFEYIDFDESFATFNDFDYDDVIDILNEIGWIDDNIYNTKHFSNDYYDITLSDNKIILNVDHWSELIDLFVEGDRYILETYIFSEDFSEMYEFDPYDDDVFESINSDSFNYIKEFIMENKENYIGEELNNGETLTMEMLNNELESLIKTDELFQDLRIDLSNNYLRSYNNAAESELFDMAHRELKSLLGESKWVSDRGVNELLFDITDIFYESLKKFFITLYEYPSGHSSYFLEVLKEVMIEENELLSLPTNLDYYHPDHTLVEKYFNESIGDYLY
jgi:hypothetical protein